jgi:hypothetical protein
MEGLCMPGVAPARLRLPPAEGAALFADAILALHKAGR